MSTNSPHLYKFPILSPWPTTKVSNLWYCHKIWLLEPRGGGGGTGGMLPPPNISAVCHAHVAYGPSTAHLLICLLIANSTFFIQEIKAPFSMTMTACFKRYTVLESAIKFTSIYTCTKSESCLPKRKQSPGPCSCSVHIFMRNLWSVKV